MYYCNYTCKYIFVPERNYHVSGHYATRGFGRNGELNTLSGIILCAKIHLTSSMNQKSRSTIWDTDEVLQDCATCLVAENVREHLQVMYPLWERGCVTSEVADPASERAALADAYRHSSHGQTLLSLYRLAVQASQVGHPVRSRRATKMLRQAETMYMMAVYGGYWEQLPVSSQENIRGDFADKLNAGQTLVALVEQFGAGILLTCATRVPRL
jgi:hypothetical protein